MNLIKIKVNEEDRETLALMLGYAINAVIELKVTSFNINDERYFLEKENKFKELRQRIVFEELKNEAEDVG